jgi:hypothetical protein
MFSNVIQTTATYEELKNVHNASETISNQPIPVPMQKHDV